MRQFRKLTLYFCLIALIPGLAQASTTLTTPTAAISPSFFGMSENGVASYSPWPAVSFATFRMWDVGTRWDQIETARGSYNWTRADKVVSTAAAHGKDIVYTFGGTPVWTSSNPGLHCLYSSGICAPPKNLADLSQFAKELATRYAGKIKYYEIWNEPNQSGYFVGSMAEMVAMARTIYDAIKSVDPTAIILSPCATWGSSGAPYPWMSSFLSAGGGAYFDIASYHAYPGSAGPEFIINSVRTMRSTIEAKGYSKAIFITEGGWGENAYVPNDTLRANFLTRYLVLSYATGVSKMIWYAYDGTSWGTLYTSSGGLRPAGTALNQLYKWMTGAVMQGCTQDASATWSCKLARSGGYSAEIVWNPSKALSYAVSSNLTRRWTVYGVLAGVSAGHVTVGPQPILVENKAGF